MQQIVNVRILGAATAALVAVAGCTLDGPPVVAAAQAINDCPVGMCGLNSPEVARGGLWMASVRGTADKNGLSIPTIGGQAYLTNGGARYALWVSGGRLYAQNASRSLSGPALIGSDIDILRYGAPWFTIQITGVHTAGRFVAPPNDVVESYTMTWRDAGSGVAAGKALCNEVLPRDRSSGFELYGIPAEDTLLFEGDLFDPDKKTTEVFGDPTWFTFGCAGHTLAKLYLHRQTIAAEPATDWPRRQAMLKMVTADYCGGGIPFTLTGEPIVWRFYDQPAYPAGYHPTTVDARWSADGATCLGEPRLADSTNPQAAILYPQVEKMIRDTCPKLKRCADLYDLGLDGDRLVSANWTP